MPSAILGTYKMSTSEFEEAFTSRFEHFNYDEKSKHNTSDRDYYYFWVEDITKSNLNDILKKRALIFKAKKEAFKIYERTLTLFNKEKYVFNPNYTYFKIRFYHHCSGCNQIAHKITSCELASSADTASITSSKASSSVRKEVKIMNERKKQEEIPESESEGGESDADVKSTFSFDEEPEDHPIKETKKRGKKEEKEGCEVCNAPTKSGTKCSFKVRKDGTCRYDAHNEWRRDQGLI